MYNLSTWEVEVEMLEQSQGQPGLNSEFQGTLGYRVRPGLKQAAAEAQALPQICRGGTHRLTRSPIRALKVGGSF